MTTRIAAAALVLSLVTISSAVASPRPTAWTGLGTGSIETTVTIDTGPSAFSDRNPATCPMSSAAEGNANQQNFPVQQYGQTSGGNRC